MKRSGDLRRAETTPRKAGKTSDLLAADLRERILRGEFSAGALPSERDMVDETGVGRGSVREALRVLAAEGLIRTKAGRNGGTFTSHPDEDRLKRFVSLFVRGRRVPLTSLTEARVTLESSLAFCAARNRTSDDIAALAVAAAQLESTPAGPEFASRNAAWHDLVAAASHNELLAAFLASITGAIAHQCAAAHAQVLEARDSAQTRTRVIRAHRGITDAVAAGDADAARRRMERHLGAFADSIAAVTASTGIEPA